MFSKRFLFLLCCLSGCVRIPESEQALVESSCGIGEDVGEALRSGAFEEGEWLGKRWWESFEDPVLTRLIEQGLRESPTLKLAEERLKAAAQVALQKKAALYPELDLEAFDLWTHLSRDGFFRAFAPPAPTAVNDFFIGLTFHYEFDFWGKNRDLFKAALGEVAARSAEAMQAELVMTSSIAYTYFELLFLLRKKELVEERRRNREAVTAIRKQRVQGALDMELDPLQARGDALEIQAELYEIEIDLKAHLHKLKALAGLSQDAELAVVPIEMKPLRLKLPPRLGLDLLGRRPDLIAQRRRLEAAAKEVDAAKTDFYPNINLLAFLGTESVFFSRLFRKENWDVGIAPALHLPIFTAGKLRAQLYEKNAAFNEAVYSYNELIVQAAREIADSLTKISSLLQEIEVRKESVNVARQQEGIALRLLNGALGTKIESLKAMDQTLQKELVLAQAAYGAQLAEIDLIRQLGGGFHE